MSLRKKIASSALIAISALGFTFIGGAPAANASSCPDDADHKVCLFEDPWWGGNVWSYANTQVPYVGDDANDKASSITNHSYSTVYFYINRDYSGMRLAVEPRGSYNTGIFDGWGNTYSNSISSFSD